MPVWRRLLIATSFINSFTLRTFAWNTLLTVKSLPCYHHISVLHDPVGVPDLPSQLRSDNSVPVNLFPKSIFVAAALILGFVDYPTAAVADAVRSSPLSLIINQRDISPSANRGQSYHWSFANGDVTLSDETYVAGMTLKYPRLLGSGAGGAVFALQQKSLSTRQEAIRHRQDVVLKVSWKGSSQDVKKECDILKKLQQSSSNHDGPMGAVEVCLGEVPYKPDPTRTVIALQPVFHDEQVASVGELLPDQRKVQTAVAHIVRTMLQMLSANVVTMDVQPLISWETGEVLFIDFTQAFLIYEGNDKSITTDMEAVVIRNFVNEMMLLIPREQQESIASVVLLNELSNYPKQSPYVYDVLMEQNFSLETLEYLSQQNHEDTVH